MSHLCKVSFGQVHNGILSFLTDDLGTISLWRNSSIGSWREFKSSYSFTYLFLQQVTKLLVTNLRIRLNICLRVSLTKYRNVIIMLKKDIGGTYSGYQ